MWNEYRLNSHFPSTFTGNQKRSRKEDTDYLSKKQKIIDSLSQITYSRITIPQPFTLQTEIRSRERSSRKTSITHRSVELEHKEFTSFANKSHTYRRSQIKRNEPPEFVPKKFKARPMPRYPDPLSIPIHSKVTIPMPFNLSINQDKQTDDLYCFRAKSVPNFRNTIVRSKWDKSCYDTEMEG